MSNIRSLVSRVPQTLDKPQHRDMAKISVLLEKILVY